MNSIKQLRRSKHITQKELAQAINVDTSLISKYENGIVSPSFDRLESIASALDVSIESLLGQPTLLPGLEDVETIYLSRSSKDWDRYYTHNSVQANKLRDEAAGVCELCGAVMPANIINGTPMLETHYIEWLSRGGKDTTDNIVVLCPTCHKYVHLLEYEDSIQYIRSKTQKP